MTPLCRRGFLDVVFFYLRLCGKSFESGNTKVAIILARAANVAFASALNLVFLDPKAEIVVYCPAACKKNKSTINQRMWMHSQ
jgi:hypothetical protein